MKATRIYCQVTIILALMLIGTVSTEPSTIFCDGEVLDVVQKSKMFDDSKYFVDMKMKFSANVIKARFQNMFRNSGGKPIPNEKLRLFVRKHFIGPDNEFASDRPHDWKEEPEILKRVHDTRLKEWARQLNKKWLQLCKVVKPDVRNDPDSYSLIYVPNSLIVPSKEFREFRYWDTYWIVLGLLRCEMRSTVRGILENLLLLVEKYGYVPNGGRIYLLDRTEIPLLIPMVKLYYQYTMDTQFIENNANTLENEFKYWMRHRTKMIEIPGKNVTLAHYNGNIPKPRPEFYNEDLNLASLIMSNETKQKLFLDLRAESETGWDSSSRWFIRKESRSRNIADINTRNIIPVDLNAVLCWNAKILSEFFEIVHDNQKTLEYDRIASEWETSVSDLLWNEIDGTWYDYDTLNNKQRKYYYASNLTPLWTKCYDQSKRNLIAKKTVQYLTDIQITYYEGGIPISLYTTDYLYDFPAVIPPYQHMIIMGLKYTKIKEAEELAFKLAFTWIRASFKRFSQSGSMYNIYHCQKPGAYGGKSNHKYQTGYGWTNGVCLDLLHTYGSVLHSLGINAGETKPAPFSKFLVFILLSLLYCLYIEINHFHVL